MSLIYKSKPVTLSRSDLIISIKSEENNSQLQEVGGLQGGYSKGSARYVYFP